MKWTELKLYFVFFYWAMGMQHKFVKSRQLNTYPVLK